MALESVFGIPELRDHIVKYLSCPRSLCRCVPTSQPRVPSDRLGVGNRFRGASKACASFYELATDSLYMPTLFVRKLFIDTEGAVALMASDGMSGHWAERRRAGM